MLSGGFGADVTDVNESPLWSGRDEIHRVPVEIPRPAPPEPPVYPAQPCLESRRCRARGVWRQHPLKPLIQSSCPSPNSTGVPGGAHSTCVASSSPALGCRFFLSCTGIRTSLCLYTLSNNQLQLSLYHSTSNHFTFYSLQSWLGSGTLIFLLSLFIYEEKKE